MPHTMYSSSSVYPHPFRDYLYSSSSSLCGEEGDAVPFTLYHAASTYNTALRLPVEINKNKVVL